MADQHPYFCDCDHCLNCAPVKLATPPRVYRVENEPVPTRLRMPRSFRDYNKSLTTGAPR